MQCAINVALNASEEFEVHEIWEKYEPSLDSVLGNIRQCPSLEDPDDVQQYVSID